MMKLFKKLFILFVIITFMTAFSSSYTSLSITNLALVVAMAVDIGENNNLQVTFQFTDSASISDTGSTEKSPSIEYTIESSSISTAVNLMNTYTGKEISLSHCKLIAFSEEIAKRGISEEIYTLINDSQIRPSTNIVITKCTAKYYIKNSKPIFENLLTKYYEVFVNSSQYTGYTANATIGNFFNAMLCNACQPYAILGGVADEKTESTVTSEDSQKNSAGKSHESPISGFSGAENTGLAVFQNSTLVGELNSIETLSFLATRNKLKGFLVSVPDPQKQGSYVDIYISPIKNSNIDVTIVNGTPYIEIDYSFTGRIYSMREDSKYLNDEVLQQISQSCNSYLESIFSNYLYKTSKELNADINSIGKVIRGEFFTLKEFEDYNWHEKYKDSFFDVNVDTKVRSGFLLTET